MHFLEIVFILIVNAGMLFFIQRFQNRVLDRRIKLLNSQVQEMEDLVAAIIEEFEEVAGTLETTEKKPTDRVENADAEPAPKITSEPAKTNFNNGITESRHQLILELNHRGLTVEEIAKELGIGRGEVSLVLGLYQRS